MQIINTAERTLALQQRRHLELTNQLARLGQQRDDILAKLVRIQTKYLETARRVGRSGKRLVDTREALSEPAVTPAPAPIEPPKRKAKAKALPVEGDPIVELTTTVSATDKAAKLREELRGERMRKRH